MKRKISIKIIFGIFLLFFLLSINMGVGSAENINRQIDFLNDQIKLNKNKVDGLKKKRDEYSQAIEDVNNQQATLENQLAILDNRVARAELEIENTKSIMDRTNLEISRINFEINQKNKKIDDEKEHISDILNLIYKQDKADALEMLLLNSTLSDFLNKVKYLKDINDEMGHSVEDLEYYKENLEKDKTLLNDKNENLSILNDKLSDQVKALEHEKSKKVVILRETENSEEKYQILLKDAKAEQKQAAQEIVNFEREVRKKIQELNADKIEINSDGLIWPVPNHYITAYFHDPSYPFRYIFEHPAIDIRASQGTNIKAAASGYVARVRWDTTSRYGYVMLIHDNGLSTVYGHISKPLVKQEDYVVQGQVIALSGGMPGTSGSGRMTTGPHLHFETRVDGIPVNPLNYLSQ